MRDENQKWLDWLEQQKADLLQKQVAERTTKKEEHQAQREKLEAEQRGEMNKKLEEHSEQTKEVEKEPPPAGKEYTDWKQNRERDVFLQQNQDIEDMRAKHAGHLKDLEVKQQKEMDDLAKKHEQQYEALGRTPPPANDNRPTGQEPDEIARQRDANAQQIRDDFVKTHADLQKGMEENPERKNEYQKEIGERWEQQANYQQAAARTADWKSAEVRNQQDTEVSLPPPPDAGRVAPPKTQQPVVARVDSARGATAPANDNIPPPPSDTGPVPPASPGSEPPKDPGHDR